jgi:hypothetical protein
VFLTGRIPVKAAIEIENFFEYVLKKYGLNKKKTPSQPPLTKPERRTGIDSDGNEIQRVTTC